MLTRMSDRLVCVLALSTIALTTIAYNANSQQPPAGRGQNSPGGQGENQGGGRWGGPEGRGQGGPGGPGGRGPSIEGSMKQIRRAMEQLHKQVNDASKKDENLRLINDMERGCVMAKGQPLPPDRTQSAKTDAERAQLNDTFHADMRKTLRLMLDVEDDLVADRLSAAATKLDQLQKMREDSHKAMGVEEEKN